MKYCEVYGKDISKEEYEDNEDMCPDCYYEYYQQLDDELDEELLEDENPYFSKDPILHFMIRGDNF